MTIIPIALGRFTEDKPKCIMASQRLPDPFDQSEATYTTGLRTSTHEIVGGILSRLKIKMATNLNSEVEESGESRLRISLFRLRKWARRKRLTSAVTSDADFRFRGVMIVRERDGSESVVTPLSNAKRVGNLLRCTRKTMVDSFKIWRLTTLQEGDHMD